MNDQDRELLAAEYVLGTLDPEARASVASALAGDGALRDLVEDWQQRLARIDDPSPGIAPPARLWDAIDAAVDREAGASANKMVLVRNGARRWRPLAPGIEWVMLCRDADRRQASALVRLAPGARMVAHDHPAAEECLLLEGDLQIGGESYRAGDFMMAPAGSRHPELVSEGGCIAYIRGDFTGMF